MISTRDRMRAVPGVWKAELVQAAENHGYRKKKGCADGWYWFASDTAPGEIAVAVKDVDGTVKQAIWFLAVEHAGAASRMAPEFPEAVAGPPPAPCRGAFAFLSRDGLCRAISRCFRLSVSLPSFPLEQFEAKIAEDGRECGISRTEILAERRQRIGQDIFRQALLGYWGCCPLTGITDAALLRASHITPWAACESDAQRLDVFNGLLLCADWDAAFDAGLISFSDEGEVLVSNHLSEQARRVLDIGAKKPLVLAQGHRNYMAYHRNHVFRSGHDRA